MIPSICALETSSEKTLDSAYCFFISWAIVKLVDSGLWGILALSKLIFDKILWTFIVSKK